VIHICFVCLGNICRSPLAEGVFKSLVQQEGLQGEIQVSSAGVGGWHVGELPDERMLQTAKNNGILLNSRARQFQPADFQGTDLVLAMDRSNWVTLEQMSPSPEGIEKIRMFRSFDPQAEGNLDVPDPYYGGNQGFDNVFEMVSRTCPEILDFIRKEKLQP
jgi:protein-tyrosine phosphatase